MRRSTITEPLLEAFVHPPEFTDVLRRLTRDSELAVLAKRSCFGEVPCPACGTVSHEPALRVREFTFCHCPDCCTLYVNPRPDAGVMYWYMQDSPLAHFLASEEYSEAVTKSRREMAERLADRISTARASVPNGRRGGVLELAPYDSYVTDALCHRQVEPVVHARMSACGLRDSQGVLALHSVAVVAGFNSLEGAPDPGNILRSVRDLLMPRGRLILTMRSGSGFDILVLWEHARLLPLSHLNLFSVEGIQIALERHGFELVELSTPGQLDVQMVASVLSGDPGLPTPRFIRYFLEHRDDFARHRLQAFLQESLMSSHLLVEARRNA